MNMLGFSAEASLYKSTAHYQGSRYMGNTPAYGITPALPPCRNCDTILARCENNGWRPRAVCDACARGDCYDEPPMPNPFPDPFPPLPRF